VFFFFSKLLDVFLSPYTWGLVLFALAVPWRRRSIRRWRRRRAFGIAAFAVLYVCSLEHVDNALVYRLEHATTSTYREDVRYDVVVLLGGMTDERLTAENGRIGYNGNVERVIVTHELLRDGKARFAIVSGAAVNPMLAEYGEARVLAGQLRGWGIAEDRIIVEDKAMNTRDNAVYAAEIVRARGFEKVLVVTSAMHMKRAVECFDAVGLRVDTLLVDHHALRALPFGPSSLIPRAGSLSGTTASLRELFGRLVYRVAGFARS
jgi:uncharacterized SAM-binding protein YcdF (DUF218 family)